MPMFHKHKLTQTGPLSSLQTRHGCFAGWSKQVPGWFCYYTEDSDAIPYFANLATGETVWEDEFEARILAEYRARSGALERHAVAEEPASTEGAEASPDAVEVRVTATSPDASASASRASPVARLQRRPSDWEIHQNEDGRIVYINLRTGEEVDRDDFVLQKRPSILSPLAKGAVIPTSRLR